MDILSEFHKKLKNERRTKKWFVDKYCSGLKFSRVNMQLLSYNTLQPEVKNAIEKFLSD